MKFNDEVKKNPKLLNFIESENDFVEPNLDEGEKMIDKVKSEE